MGPLAEAAQEIDAFMRAHGWSYCIVGGIAIARWGEPRATADVDLCLLTGLGGEQAYLAPLLKRFAARIKDASEFAERNRVVLLNASNGVGIDIALGWMPFEAAMVRRAVPYEMEPGIVVHVASAEELVITKAFASRPLDWVDIQRILARQRGRLDWDYIRRELSVLCELKEAPEIVAQLERMRQEIDAE